MSGVYVLRRMGFACIVRLTLLLCVCTRAVAAYWEASLPPEPVRNLTRADFRLWVEDRSDSLPVAVLVLLTGWNGDGRELVNSSSWQAFARQNRLALLGVWFESSPEDEQAPPYHLATQGSGDVLLQALERLGTKAGQPRMGELPLVFWGHSAGGQFGYGMACHRPDRVAAFVAIKGGIYGSQPQPDTYGVPGLFIVGEEDHPQRAMNITWLFETGRTQGASWCIAFEPGGGHDIGAAQTLALPFLHAVIASRVASSGHKLNAVNPSQNWFGLRSTLTVKRGSPHGKEMLPRTVWLPDNSSAQAWVSFSTGE